jgi:hypothetical protein
LTVSTDSKTAVNEVGGWEKLPPIEEDALPRRFSVKCDRTQLGMADRLDKALHLYPRDIDPSQRLSKEML